MSINGSVKTVHFFENGEGYLELVGDEKGQKRLHFITAPHDVTALNGRQVWGSGDTLMHGETQIARRHGYTRISFTVDRLGPVIAKEKKRLAMKELPKMSVFHS